MFFDVHSEICFAEQLMNFLKSVVRPTDLCGELSEPKELTSPYLLPRAKMGPKVQDKITGKQGQPVAFVFFFWVS